MNNVIDRFRRFETLLHVLLDAATAEMVTNLAVIFIEAAGNTPEVIPWRSLAARCGQTGPALQDILTEANAATRNALGFPLIAREIRTYFEFDEFSVAGEEDTETAGIALSKEFQAILTGASAPYLWIGDDSLYPNPDTTGTAMITLLRDVAQTGGAPFLYRQAESEDPLRYLEMTGFAEALGTGSDVPVYMAAAPMHDSGKPDWTAVLPLASLLSAVLHVPEVAIILFPFTDQLGTEEPRPDDEEENFYVPVRKANRPRMLLTHQAKGGHPPVATSRADRRLYASLGVLASDQRCGCLCWCYRTAASRARTSFDASNDGYSG